MEPELIPYQWLIDALKPHCDRVITFVDIDGRVGIGAQWGGPLATMRHAVAAEGSLAEGSNVSINAAIEAGRTTRRRVINCLLVHQPML